MLMEYPLAISMEFECQITMECVCLQVGNPENCSLILQPITDVTSNDVICNGGINPYHTPISTTVIPVPAGAQVTAEWHHTLNGADPTDSADPIDPSHKGPVIAYLCVLKVYPQLAYRLN
jgi:hypothetical protein